MENLAVKWIYDLKSTLHASEYTHHKEESACVSEDLKAQHSDGLPSVDTCSM
jgi:hypothetical protein